MPATPRKKGTYYDRKALERRAYQQAYYARNKAELARKRELEALLNPESRARYLEYQREYYLRRKAERTPR